MKVLIMIGILDVLILWAALIVPMSEYERKADDEAQEEFLRKRDRMKENLYTIYKHTKGLPDYLDYDLNDYEDFTYFETRSEAENACKYLNEKWGDEYNYYVVMV